MKKSIKIILFSVLIILILIQFIPVDLPENKAPDDNDIVLAEEVSSEISRILGVACYDCHSNQIHYPFYSYIAPVSWLVARDIRLGVEDLNLSEWGMQTKRQKLKLLDQMADEVKSGSMPFPIYKISHPDARLSEQEREYFINWTEELTEKVFEE